MVNLRYIQSPSSTVGIDWDLGNTKLTGLTQGTASGEVIHAGRAVNTSTGLSGGGNLTADLTLSLDTTYTDGRYVNVTGDTMTGSLRIVDVLDIDSHSGATEGAQINLKKKESTGGGETDAWTIDVDGSNNLRLFYNGGTSVTLDSNANIGIGTATFGTSATQTLALFNGTAPTTSPADTVQLFSVDAAGAGTASLGLRTEVAVVTETVTSDRTLQATINGVVYKFCLKS